MANIGERSSLKIIREKSFGLYLDGGDLGEVLLPHREVPADNVIGGFLDVFIYTDSEDRPVATCKTPKAMPGEFARLKCVAITGVGAFLDWGLPKELLVPFGEQKERMEPGKTYLVHVLLDKVSGRIIASGRLTRHIDKTPHDFKAGDEVDLVIYAKTALGYKAVINNTHTGLLYAEGVFQPLQPGERVKGYISTIREDGKIDLTLHAPGRAGVAGLEERVLTEIRARGGFWALGDHSPAAEIHDELGVSKRIFKQAIGALLRKHLILIEPRGLRIAEEE
jgi:predicted RNA-binding protein (virulence factor B family)